MYIHNDDLQNHPFYRLKFVVETFEQTTLQSKITNEQENVIIKLLGLVK